ncbi:MAG: EAL domain-containing protein [Pseudomonadota bacterium]
MTLKVKIQFALLVGGMAVLAGLLPAFLALREVEAGFANTVLGAPTPDAEAVAALADQITFALWAMAPGAASLTLALIALALWMHRLIVSPLRGLAGQFPDAAQAAFASPDTLDRTDEIGQLSQAIATTVSALDAAVQAGGTAATEDTDARYLDLLTLAADFVWETDMHGRLTHLAGALPEELEASEEDYYGHPLQALLSVPTDGGTDRPLELDSRRPLTNLLCCYETAGGEKRYCRLSGHAVFDDTGTFSGYCGIANDVTVDLAEREAARILAYDDALTGLANRTLVLERIDQALEARPLSGGDVAVLFVELDRFKDINDRFGHELGDHVLREVGTRLHQLAGPQDTVGRIGGDAFAMVQSNAAQPEAAEHACLSILTSLALPFTVENQSLELTASLGCAVASTDDTGALDLLRNADIAMYRAKDEGGNTYRFHETQMAAEMRGRVAMERDLRHAIADNQLEVNYQPLMQTATGSLTGFEARVRWPRQGHGMVYPEEFLSLAEKSGLIAPLSASVLSTACRTAMSWPDLVLAVNLSPIYFLDDTLLKTLVQTLRDSNLSAHLLELEITEAALLSAENTALFQFDALRELGVRMVMDKFGSGTSSLQHLQRFRFDKLKLHRGFISGIETDPSSAEIVRSVLQLGAALGLETAADGVANKDQARLLKKLGCQTLQGPFFGKALSANRAFALLRSKGIMPGAPKAERHL